MKTCRNLLIAGVAGAIMLIGAPSALSASKNVDIHTTDPNPGGTAAFIALAGGGFKLQVCDVQTDGYGVTASATTRTTKSGAIGWPVRDVDGNNGRCASRYVPAAPGAAVALKVCLKDHDGRDNPDGTLEGDVYCATVQAKA